MRVLAAEPAVPVTGANPGVLVFRLRTAEVRVGDSRAGGLGKVWRAWNA